MQKLDTIDAPSLRDDLPEFRAGDTVRVNVKITEGDRSRVQAFEGIVLARHGDGIRETFTVRRIRYGRAVEREFPLHAPTIESIEIVHRGRAGRAKLYYLRGLHGKAAKIRARR